MFVAFKSLCINNNHNDGCVYRTNERKKLLYYEVEKKEEVNGLDLYQVI